MDETNYQVLCIGPERWKLFVEAAFSSLSEDQQRLAESILVTLHDQHIGITPLLLTTLVVTLLPDGDARHRSIKSPWTDVYDCLARAMITIDKPRPQFVQAIRPQIVRYLSRSPLYTISRLVAPLIAAACQQIGYSYLFSHQNNTLLVNVKNYSDYHDKLVNTIKDMARERHSESHPYDLFWLDTANMLVKEQSLNFSLPETDPPTAALFHRLDELPQWADDQTLRRLHTLITPIRTRHRQEGGVRGIRTSRRLEDIHNILLSEFMIPEELLVDRLLNSGYLIYEREPKREKLRDMLLMGIMPGLVRHQTTEKQFSHNQLSADFAKTCWFNLAAHLGLLLRQYNLWRSEFRWIEGDLWDRIRVESHLLLEMEQNKRRVSDVILDKVEGSRQRRHFFLQQMNWLPDYLDTRARYHPLDGWNDSPPQFTDDLSYKEEQSLEKQQLQEIVDWVRRTQLQQMDNPRWKELHVKSSRNQAILPKPEKLAIDEFNFIHIVVFLPAVYREAWGGEAQGMLNIATRMRRENRLRNMSIMWVPTTIISANTSDTETKQSQVEDWWFTAPHHPQRRLLNRSINDPTEIADTLVKSWLDELMREIQHV
jgi:hypothetical protein